MSAPDSCDPLRDDFAAWVADVRVTAEWAPLRVVPDRETHQLLESAWFGGAASALSVGARAGLPGATPKCVGAWAAMRAGIRAHLHRLADAAGAADGGA